MADVEIILALLVAVAALATLADWLGVPYPILLVLGGVALGISPGVPVVQIPPNLVFVLFVPPLVFVAAFFTSWRDFVASARPILDLAVGLVIVSAVAVAVIAHFAIEGIPWAPAFVLGAVVSNTDTTAVVAVAERVGLPRRLVTILEGESLVNDAVSLTLFRVAVAATVTGSFSPWRAGGDFALAVLGAAPIGLAVGWLTAAARAHTDDPRVVIIIGLVTPYAAYLPADQLGASGILAVVIAGLYVGRRESRIEDAETRLQAHAVWDMLIFAVNGLLFILVGIQLRPIWHALPSHRPGGVLGAAARISLTVILARIVWIAVIAGARRKIRGVEAVGSGGEVAVAAWAGLRGGDTLAAALSVPVLVDSGTAFPAREMILFLAFVVILVTLVGQGLTLAPMIRWLGMGDDPAVHREEALARRTAAEAALERIDQLEREGAAPPGLLDELRRRYRHEAKLALASEQQDVSAHVQAHERLKLEVLNAMHAALLRLRDEQAISDGVFRRIERDLDLEAARFDR